MDNIAFSNYAQIYREEVDAEATDQDILRNFLRDMRGVEETAKTRVIKRDTGREIVGVIGYLRDSNNKPCDIVFWVESDARQDKGKASYTFPILGPYAQSLYDSMFKKWG